MFRDPNLPSETLIIELTYDDDDVDQTTWRGIVPDGDFDESVVRQAVVAAARSRRCLSGSIGVFLTGDRAIRRINRDHLNHDHATDVISFGYECRPPHVEGELVVSVETAAAQARRIGRRPVNELLLYVIHGTLHITGMDDQTPEQRRRMRSAEQAVLRTIGVHEDDDFTADRFVAFDGLGVDDRPSTRDATG